RHGPRPARAAAVAHPRGELFVRRSLTKRSARKRCPCSSVRTRAFACVGFSKSRRFGRSRAYTRSRSSQHDEPRRFGAPLRDPSSSGYTAAVVGLRLRAVCLLGTMLGLACTPAPSGEDDSGADTGTEEGDGKEDEEGSTR